MLNGIPAGDLAHTGIVDTLFGPMPSSPVYRKGQAELWTVTLRSGRSIVVTERHHFLTLSGWRPLASLAVGDLVAADGTENDSRYSGKPKDCLPHYSRYSRPYGAVPSPVDVAYRESLHRLSVLGIDPIDTHLYLSTGGSSHLSVPNRQEDANGCRDGSDDAGSLHRLPETFWQSGWWTALPNTWRLFRSWATSEEDSFLFRWLFQLLSDVEVPSDWRRGVLQPLSRLFQDVEMLRQLETVLSSDLMNLSSTVARSASAGLTLALDECLTLQQQPCRNRTPQWLQAVQQPVHVVNSYDTSDYNDTSFWDEVSSISYHSFGDFYDLTVPIAEHYFADGIINKNSGKSVTLWADLVWNLRHYPGGKAVIMSAYDYYWDEFILPTFESVMSLDNPFIIKANLKSRIFHCANGSTFRFHAYDDSSKIKGWDAHWLYVEEGSEVGGGNSWKAMQIIRAALMRLRAKPKNIPRFVRIAQNPNGHNYLWKMFIRNNPFGDVGKETTIDPCRIYDKRLEDAHVRATKETHAGRRIYDPDKQIPNPDPRVIPFNTSYNEYRGRIKECCKTCDKQCKNYPNGLSYAEFEKVDTNGDVYYTIASGSDANTTLPEGYISTMEASMEDDKDMLLRMVKGRFNPIQSLVYFGNPYYPDSHIITMQDVLEAYDWDRMEEPGIPEWIPAHVGIDVGGPKSPWAVEIYRILPDLDGQGEIAVCTGEWYRAGVYWDDVIAAVGELCYGLTQVSFWIDPYSAPQKQGASQISVKEHFESAGIVVGEAQGANII